MDTLGITALPFWRKSFKLLWLIFLSLNTSFYLQHTNILVTASFITSTRTVSGNETDRVALLAFKSKITHDPRGVFSSWNDSLHFCGWEGITCGRRHHQRVTALHLHSRGLEGVLSPYIGNLSFLRVISLSNNSLKGEIPREVGRLFRLQHLRLENNSLSGEIPSNLSHCSNLISIRIGYNKLTGKIPTELSSLSMLQIFSFHINNLTGGGIPPFIGNLTSLVSLSAAFNELGGRIPDALGKLKSLRFLGLESNKLLGMVPPSIYNLSSLSSFSLSNNQLYGSLPPDLFLTLPHLQEFQLWGNYFTGSIPVSLSNASKLEYIDMSVNNFTGKISTNFGGMQHLWLLSLGGNNFGTGEADEMNFIASLCNCSSLEVLDLMGNQLGGTLPNYVGNLSTKLSVLRFGRNQISGVIPSGIGNLFGLAYLGMSLNRFTGSIPSHIGNLQNLHRLYLSFNALSGEIPFSLGNISSLNEFYLADNELEGTIPSSLGNFRNLLMLDFSQNDLSGTIPEQIFGISSLSMALNLSNNRLNGSLSSNVGNLRNVGWLDVSENKLFGEIPSDIGRCLSLEYLNMAGNFFQGPIPPSLSNLRGMQIVDLSRNNLSGQIPKYFEDIPLQSLNLSFNDFEGEVPIKGVFSNASAISVTGNNRLCGGIFELKLPKCISKESKKRKMSHVLVIIIPIAAAILGATIVVSFLLCWLMKRRKKGPIGSLLKETFLKISYQEILRATDGFSSANLIGAGSFGSVYKGILDETVVAVKVFNLQRRGASKSFTAECKALRNIRHRNLLKIITSCSSTDFNGNEFKALICEFMPNGNLERWLHQNYGQEGLQKPSLLQRINIAIDVACALDYLHHRCQEPIIHCDLKPNNILLDSDMTAHVGDFGLARFLPQLTNPSQTSSIGIRGTIGYAAPEYGIGNEVSTFGDIYSYGILLLEMITGKRPTDGMFDECLNLHNFAKMALPDQLMQIVDPSLHSVSAIASGGDETIATSSLNPTHSRNGGRTEECLRWLVEIGVACSMEAPQDRMDMSKVVSDLHLLRDILLQIRVPRQTA